MQKIEWEDRFSVNISTMDEEHKCFILIINKIIASRHKKSERENVSDALNEMTRYALSHFKSEEEHMINFDYPEYHQHKKEHKEFLMTTVGFCQCVMNRDYNVMDDLFGYLKQWLSDHIEGTDKKYTECFNKNGLI